MCLLGGSTIFCSLLPGHDRCMGLMIRLYSRPPLYALKRLTSNCVHNFKALPRISWPLFAIAFGSSSGSIPAQKLFHPLCT